MWQGRPLGDARPSPQMFGSQDGSVEEHALSSILKTALGVAELTVTHLFRAIDQERKGRITFGEWPRAGEDSPAPPEPGRAGAGLQPPLCGGSLHGPSGREADASRGLLSGGDQGPWEQEGFRLTPRAPPLRGAWPWHLSPCMVGQLHASGSNPPRRGQQDPPRAAGSSSDEP